MKNLMNLKNAKILSKKEQKSIIGGLMLVPAQCTAYCGKDASGNDVYISCSGNNCTATDYSNCSADGQEIGCPGYAL